MAKVKDSICTISLMVTDIISLFVSFLIANFFRSTLLLPVIPGFKQIKPLPLMPQLKQGFLYAALAIILVFFYEKLYSRRLPFWEDTKYLFKGLTVSFILIMVLVFVSRQFILFSRALIVLAWMMSLTLFPLLRTATKKILLKMGLWQKRIIVLGTKNAAKLVTQSIRKNHLLGYKVAAFLTEDAKKTGKTLAGIPIMGDLNQLKKLSKQLGVKNVIIALPDFPQKELINIIENCEDFFETIRIVPNIGSIFTLGVIVETLGDISTLSVTRNLVKPSNIFIKSIFEYILAIAIFTLLLPVFLIISFAIKIDSTGPVIFIQERLGKKGKVFKLYKFRSMYVDGDQRLEKFLEENPKAQKEWNKFQKVKENDPRITRVGKIIRKYSLDEIPQLINFFKRNMNLVGPRPYLPREKVRIGKRSQIISRVKPGITGLWQVRGRSLLSFKERLVLDEYYIRNWSLWTDIFILLKTIDVFITQEGAY